MQMCFKAALLVALVAFSTHAFADFYVISTGKRAARTILVSPKNTRAESGAALLNALAKITDASETKPYLVIIEPGIFDVGSTPVEMKNYVDIQGSGQGKTTIQGNVSGINTGLVIGSHMAELRHVTVKNWGTAGHVAALHNGPSLLFSILDVTAEARGGSVNYGVINRTSSKMTNVTAFAAGWMNSANYAVYNQNASPTMMNVTATATGGSTNIGVYNLFASPTMTLVTARASGGNDTYGLWNALGSPVLNQVVVTATGGRYSNIGIQVVDGQVTMNHVNVTASGGSASHGIFGHSSSTTSTVRVNHSILSGETSSVQMRVSSRCFVGNTQLIGKVGGAGSVKCAGVYDGNYTFFANTCP